MALFVLCLLVRFLPIWEQGISQVVPSVQRSGVGRYLAESDLRLGVWGASRNAWVLTHAPWHFFDAESCYPTPRSLTLGHPMLSLGVLGVPVRLVAPDPVATYNGVLALIVLSSALAMYLLVREWTGVPAAGMAAGVLFAFHPVALDRLFHLQIYDLSWTVWALLFATRLCRRQRWRDALGLGAALVLQMGESFYTAAISALVCAPIFTWLLWRHRKSVRPAHALAVLAIALAGAVLVYGPYLVARETENFERPTKFFLSWSAFLPGGPRDPGFWLWSLAAAGLVAGRPARAGAGGDPRAALVAAGLLSALAAAGGVAGSLWMYAALSRIPGFATVRTPLLLAEGSHLALCALAGLGVAAAVRAAPPRMRALAASALVAATLAVALLPTPLSGPEQATLYAFPVRPSDAEIDFYAELAARGNAGPILELPLLVNAAVDARSRSVLLTAYHHRPVSTCYNSILPRARAVLEELAAELPAPAAQQRARELGFTTIVIRHPPDSVGANVLRARFEAAERAAPAPLLRPLLTTPERSAYALAEP